MVAAAIVAVLYVAVSGPDQPATLQRKPPRTRPPRPTREDRRRAAEEAAARAAEEEAAVARARAATNPTPTASPPAPGPWPQPALSGAGALALPESDPMRIKILPAKPTTLWVRVRSGAALLVLVAVLGALLAITIGAVILGAAFLLRSATS